MKMCQVTSFQLGKYLMMPAVKVVQMSVTKVETTEAEIWPTVVVTTPASSARISSAQEKTSIVFSCEQTLLSLKNKHSITNALFVE